LLKKNQKCTYTKLKVGQYLKCTDNTYLKYLDANNKWDTGGLIKDKYYKILDIVYIYEDKIFGFIVPSKYKIKYLQLKMEVDTSSCTFFVPTEHFEIYRVFDLMNPKKGI